jgi:hypothetical protein
VAAIDEQGARLHSLTAAEIGKTFKSAAVPSDSTLPCLPKGSQTLPKLIHALFNVKVSYQSDNPAGTVDEQVLGFADAATARTQLLEVSQGLDCANGYEYRPKHPPALEIVGPRSDVSSKVHAPQAYIWQITTLSQRAVLVIMVAGTTIVLLRFGLNFTQPHNSSNTLPDPDMIAGKAYSDLVHQNS